MLYQTRTMWCTKRNGNSHAGNGWVAILFGEHTQTSSDVGRLQSYPVVVLVPVIECHHAQHYKPQTRPVIMDTRSIKTVSRRLFLPTFYSAL